ncbi:Endolytic murein transglycosylase [Gammaproteobacteria bacterium]|nr:endolytic transglycosylase MltG [Gammaproteobacteria bacterium]QOJ31565.1 MAG: endolytic transglycosylase MltG [Gammaproteobacteria bacterium]CAG0944957.1 Endolytic murein transglycosylase [Gammaproteobacteria bacterium]
MMRRIMILAGLFLGLAGAAWFFGQGVLNKPMALPDGGLTVDVPAGMSLRALGERLAAEDVLQYPTVLVAYARLMGQASAIKAGEYEIAAGTTPRGLLQQLVEGRVRLHSLTIVEGWTTRDLVRALRKSSYIRFTESDADDKTLVRAVELPGPSPEGWFFPDTYRFPKGTTDRELLRMAHERMQVVLDQAWAGRAAGLPLRSPYEALILASIVEKETALDRERPRVAGVLARRLKAGMKLQTDPTVIYGLGEDFTGDLTRRQLSRDSPYNTYTRTGLPPTPISLPGEASILAAVHPDDSDALYFVASPERDGSHVFSATLREHNAAVKKYLESLRDNGK